MATFAALTSDQRNELLALMPLVRSMNVQFSKTMNQLAALDSLWNSNLKAVNALLDAGVVIPDSSGLDGASSLTKDDLITFFNAMETVLAVNNSAAWRTFFVRAAGLSNTMLLS